MCNACPPAMPYATGVPFYFIVINWNGTVLKDKNGKIARFKESYVAEERILEEMQAGRIGEYNIFKSVADARPTGNFKMVWHF